MGIDRRITAAPPEPDLRLVAPVLDRWKRRDPDQFKLSEFGLQYIQSKLRCWADELDDGLGREMRWICFGCRFDFIYGFNEGNEIFIVTAVVGWDHDPCCETIKTLRYVAFAPGSRTFCRLSNDTHRILNRVEFAPTTGASANGRAIDTAQASPLSGYFNAGDGDFAPPWLPGDYLRAHVPKHGDLRHALKRRPHAGRIQEFTMEKINFASMLFATRVLNHFEALDRVDGLTGQGVAVRAKRPFGLFAFRDDATMIRNTKVVDIDDGMDGTGHPRATGGQTGLRSTDVLTAPQAE